MQTHQLQSLIELITSLLKTIEEQGQAHAAQIKEQQQEPCKARWKSKNRP